MRGCEINSDCSYILICFSSDWEIGHFFNIFVLFITSVINYIFSFYVNLFCFLLFIIYELCIYNYDIISAQLFSCLFTRTNFDEESESMSCLFMCRYATIYYNIIYLFITYSNWCSLFICACRRLVFKLVFKCISWDLAECVQMPCSTSHTSYLKTAGIFCTESCMKLVLFQI